MNTPDKDEFPRPAWNQAAIWMGCDLAALSRIMRHYRWRVDAAFWFEASIDLTFATGNSLLRMIQAATCNHRVRRVALPDDPVFILGHWRTGTTLLHELLALDPLNRCPTTYECLLPHHFLLTERWLKRWIAFALPSRRPPDNMAVGWDRPQEDEFALSNMGVASPYWQIGFPNEPPMDASWFDLSGLSDKQRHQWQHAFRTFLQRLLCHRAGRLVLKSPPHTFRVATLVEMFPRARFVHIVRNPFEVYSSTVKLWKSLFSSLGYQKPNYRELDEFVLRTFAQMHESLQQTRPLVASERFLDVRYEQLVADPVSVVGDIYEQLQLEGFDGLRPALTRYASDHTDYKPNRHELDDATRAVIAERWRSYFETYGY